MRSDAREAAFQVIFARILGGDCPQSARNAIYKKANLNEEEKAFADRLISVVEAHTEEFSQKLSETVVRYADYRIYPADKAVLLLALAEIEYFEDIPPVVSVNEAAGLARKYSTENSADFVNGVLGGIINQ